MPVRKASRAKQNSPIKPLRLEDFKYHDELGIALPQLALCIEVDRRSLSEDGDARTYRFKPGRTWLKLAHQTAGHACHQRYLWTTLLTPKTVQVAQGLAALDRKWEGSQAGCFGTSLDILLDYRADLKRLFGADCNVAHRDFEEGFYGIDAQFLPQLAADAFPSDLDELIHWENGFQRFAGCVGRFKLVVLGENSD